MTAVFTDDALPYYATDTEHDDPAMHGLTLLDPLADTQPMAAIVEPPIEADDTVKVEVL